MQISEHILSVVLRFQNIVFSHKMKGAGLMVSVVRLRTPMGSLNPLSKVRIDQSLANFE